MADPWAEFADAKGDPWREFDDAPVTRTAVPLRPTGAVHDGDTFGLNSGSNASTPDRRAFELAQVGHRRDGSLVPLGKDARGFLKGQVSPNSTAIDTGTRSYGRPVMMLENGGQDVGPSILRSGLGMATPHYLRDDPRLGTYMEAERFARQNRQGAFGTQFQAPWEYRRNPWSPAELSTNGKGAATFWDEPTPFQGVRPEIAQGYIALAQDPKSTAADLMAYAKANGFTIDPRKAEQFIKARSQPGAKVSDQVTYEELPPVLTDSGDGALGSALRGVADPINMLDEMGGVVDALGGTQGRESVWNSDRRFGDILWNNIDQYRDILRYDDAFRRIDRGNWPRCCPHRAAIGREPICGGGRGKGSGAQPAHGGRRDRGRIGRVRCRGGIACPSASFGCGGRRARGGVRCGDRRVAALSQCRGAEAAWRLAQAR
jgi:endonuclease YncB( thermonuclease family)